MADLPVIMDEAQIFGYLAYVLDNKVVQLVGCNERQYAILTSQPTLVALGPSAGSVMIEDTWFPEEKKFRRIIDPEVIADANYVEQVQAAEEASSTNVTIHND